MKTLASQFGGQIIEGLAGNLGLGKNDAESAMGSAVSTILGGLINNVGTSSGADDLYNVIKKDHDGGILDNLGSVFGNSSLLETGAAMLPMILGGQSTSSKVVDLAGRLLGIGGKSRSVLGMLAPIVMGFIGKQISGKSNGKQGLIDLLLGQKEHVAKAAHPEMASLLGFNKWGGQSYASGGSSSSSSHSSTTTKRTVETAHREEEKGGGGFLKMLLPLLLLGLLGLFAWKMCGTGGTDGKVKGDDQKSKVQTEQTTKSRTNTSSSSSTTTRTDAKTRTGTNAGTAGSAANGGAAKVDSKDGAVSGSGTGDADVAAGAKTYTGSAAEFANAKSGTRVNFGTVSDGKALSASARATFDQVAEIMKANPDMKIDIRAHSKDHGNVVENSAARAACKVRAGLVQAYLKLKGVALDRIKSSSIGKKEPLSGIDAKDDKQKRIEIEVL